MNSLAVRYLCGATMLSVLSPWSSQAQSSQVEGEVFELEPFKVVSTGEGYLHSTSAVATRTNRRTIEIPQTISVMTAEFLEDTSAFNAEDAIQYVSNTFMRDRFGDPGNVVMRGFEREGARYVDGFRSGNYRRDTYAYERMEVVKGPPSAVQGRAGGSGIINWVLKKPTLGSDFLKTNVTYSGFEEDLFRFVWDYNRTLREVQENEESSGVRAVGIVQRGDSWIDQLPDDKTAIYPSFRWRKGNTEAAIFGGYLESKSPSREIGTGPSFYAKEYRDLFDHPDLGGLEDDPISALNLPYGGNPVGPQNVRNDEVANVVASVSHEFDERFSFRQAVQYLHTEMDSLYFEPNATLSRIKGEHLGVVGTWLPTSRGANDRSEERVAVQGDFVANLFLGDSVRSSTLAGYEWFNNNEERNNYSLVLKPEYTFVNIETDFEAESVFWEDRIEEIVKNTNRLVETENFGYYVQQEFEFFNRGLIQGAWRRDKQDMYDENTISGNITDISDSTDSYRYGGTYFLNDKRNLSLYAVYSDRRDPKESRLEWSGLNPGDSRLDDRLEWEPAMELTEFGFKSELLDRNLSITAAYFDLRKTGNLNTYSNIPTESQGETVFANRASLADSVNRGWEFEVVGNLRKDVSFTGNVSFNDSNEVRVFGSEVINQRIHRVPDYDVNLFLKWDLRRENKNGFVVRGGVSTYRDFEGTFNGIRTTLDDAMTTYDAGVAYKWGDHNIDLFFKNLTDAPIVLFRGGVPRSLRVSVSSRW